MSTTVKGKLLVGITGGIGSGKTEACRMLAEEGFKVFYADPIAKELYVKDKNLAAKIVKEFGKEIVNFRGKINLSKMRQVIFANKKNYQNINKIVHPVVIDYIRRQAQRAKAKVIIVESALIFESGLYKDMDYVITVYSNKKNRVDRIVLRDGASKKEVESIMKYQMDDKLKIEKSDFVIVNNKTLDDLREQIRFVSKVLHTL